MIDKVFDNEKENDKNGNNKKIKIYLIKSESYKDLEKKNNEKKKNYKSFHQIEDTNRNKIIKNFENTHKSVSICKIFQFLLCCCPTS